MATEVEELLGFLSSPSPQLKKAAADIVRDLTGSEDGLLSLAGHSEVALPSLSQLLCEKKELSEPAAEALINMSQNSSLSEKMISIGMVKTAMEMLYRQECCIRRLLVMLLVNLTQLDAGIASLLQIQDDKVQGLYVMKLVRSFCRSSSEAAEDPFEHVASILVNISKMEAGRKILLDPKRGLLKQIIPQFDSTNPLRKKGGVLMHFVMNYGDSSTEVEIPKLWLLTIDSESLCPKMQSHYIRVGLGNGCNCDLKVSGTIRNCCFEAESQLQNLLLISEFLWPALLLPVAGKKAYRDQDTSKMPLELGNALSHEREAVDDPEIRVQALEAIYMIALQDTGRRALWSVNGPRILQVGYEDEEDPKVMEAYEQIGSLLVHGGEAEEPAVPTET